MNKEINFGPSDDGSVDQMDSKFYNNGALKNEYINGIHNGITQWNSSNFGWLTVFFIYDYQIKFCTVKFLPTKDFVRFERLVGKLGNFKVNLSRNYIA